MITWEVIKRFLPLIALAVFGLMIAGVLGLTYKIGKDKGAATCEERHREQDEKARQGAAKLEKKQNDDTVQVRIEYVDRIVEVEKRVPVVTERLVSVCNKAVQVPASGAPVPSVSGVRPGGAAANANDRPADSVDQLGEELIACRNNAELHRALRATAIANGAATP